MSLRLLLLACVLWISLTKTQRSLEELMRAAVTVYLLIAGFLVLVWQRRAGEFLRPLVPIGLALLFLPPLFADLVRTMKGSIHVSVTLPSLSLGSGWLRAVPVAIVVFVLFRLFLWHRRRPRPTGREILRDRERVPPPFEVEDPAERT